MCRIYLLAACILLAAPTFAQKDWKVYTSAVGAFSVDFPGEPQINSINRQNEEGVNVKLHMHMVSANSIIAYVFYSEFETGTNILEEGLYLDQVAAEMIKRVNQDTSKIETIEFNGYPARKFSIVAKDGVLELITILRNNRPYIVGGFFPTKQKEGMQRFMKSFKFLPFQKPEWTSYQSKENFFKADFPMEPVQDNEEGMEVYYGMNLNSGDNYSIAVDKYSGYDQFESDSAVLANRIEGYLSEEDSVLVDRELTIDGRPARERVIQKGENHFQLRVRTTYNGLYGYTLFAFLEPAEVNSESVNHFFNSFHFQGKPEGDLLSDKASLLLKDIASNDTAVWKKAAPYIEQHEFEEKHVDALHNLVKQSFPDDADSIPLRKIAIFDALQNLGSEKSIPFVEANFQLLAKNNKLQIEALRLLIDIGTVKSLDAVVRVLPKHKPSESTASYTYNFLFTPYNIDSAQQKSYLLKAIKFLPQKEYKGGLYSLADHLLKNKSIKMSDLSAHHKMFLQDFQQQAKTFFQDSATADLSELIDMLGYENFGIKETAMLQRIASGPYEFLQINASVTLIRLGQVPTKNRLDSLASKHLFRNDLYRSLAEYNLQSKFPQKYANQDSLALGDLYSYISYDYAEPAAISIVHKEERQYHDVKKLFYVIRFFDPDEESWYLGISGPYDPKKLEVDGVMTYSDFTVDEGIQYDDYLTNQITIMEE